ncbi:MAG TPA: NAD(P)-binding domain-containing protein, partial [Terriglobales bacterium]|nr:NAD(P)-binding domain-containing protein [Terriglobales bacterium]
NQVTLCYRGAQFSRIKERNAQRIADCMKSGKVQVLFNSNPVEFKAQSVVLEVAGQQREIPNDYVWIFAGGVPPNDFLKKIGVGFGSRDMTQDASTEAKEAEAGKKALRASPRPVTAPLDTKLRPVPVSQLGIPGEELPKVSYQLDDAAKYSDNDILIIGGGDNAIHAAVALSHAQRNRVTLSYRGDHFQHGPERNQHMIETAEREKKIRILRKCAVAAITQDSVILDVDGNPAEIPNDKVFILLDGDASVEFQSAGEAAALK